MARVTKPLEFPPELYPSLEKAYKTGVLLFARPRDVGLPELPKDMLLAKVSRMYEESQGTVRLAFIVLIGDRGTASFSHPGVVFDGSLRSYQVLSLLSYYVPQALSWYLSGVFPSQFGCAFCDNRELCSNMSMFLLCHGMASGVQSAVRDVSGAVTPDETLPHVLEYLRHYRDMLDLYIGLVESMLRREGSEGSDQR